jgi:hypothetical protein
MLIVPPATAFLLTRNLPTLILVSLIVAVPISYPRTNSISYPTPPRTPRHDKFRNDSDHRWLLVPPCLAVRTRGD